MFLSSSYHYTVFPCRHGLNRNTDTPTTNRSSSNAAYQRIISHSGACRYNYLTHGFRDVSSVIRGLDRTPLTRIHFNKSFVFFTQTAAKEYEEQRRSFFRDCQPRDDYMEMREGMDLMDIDFPEEVIVVRDLDRVPWWRRKSTFMVAVLCLQAAPLRILLALQTATLHYNVLSGTRLKWVLFSLPYLQVFGMDERESNWPGPPGLGSFHADEPDLLPPSYSEIMLHEGSPVPAWGLGRLLLQRTGRLVKSATFGCSSNSNAENAEREKPVESYELSEGVRARGIDADGYNPLTPTSELKALRDVTDVLRRNGPRMFSQRFMMTRSNTAPVFSGAQRERLRIDGLRNFAYEAI
ncbi:putative Transmembrane protein 151-like protein [Hypsibius exemplaris]|uniref:Transmembrane protein 151-like protein n=1 Tax=Hypsibius exemplaris TaxID=2072580 RepID=A0A1W0X6B4_HYPEX|nr:putative Transmembrane protein 151-like protein [Hypsibius exemplaris]